MARRRKRYRSAEQVRLELRDDLRRVSRAAIAGLLREAAQAGLEELEEAASPIRSFQGTIRVLVDETIRPLATVSPETKKIQIGSTAQHWYALDSGRRRQHYRGGWTREGGSDKVPRGMTKPASERFLGRWPEIQQQAVDAGEAAL